MHPVLVDFGTWDLPFLGQTHLYLPSYGFLFAAGTLLAWWWFVRRARKLELPEDKIFNLCFYSLLGGILGAKVLLILIDWRYYLSHPGAILGTLRSAGVLVGGVIGGSAVFIVYARAQGLPLAKLSDAVVAPLALAQSVGRLGCFSAGCCWGTHTGEDNPFAMVFTDPMAAAQTRVPLNVPLVPTQVLQMGNDLLLVGILTWLWRRRLEPAGTVAWFYVLLYSVGRGTIELWRGDAERGLYLSELISTSQLFAVAGIVVATIALLRGRRARRTLET